MPIINFSTVITAMNGEPMLDMETKKPVTLVDIVLTALNLVLPEERSDAKDKIHRYKLSCCIVDGGEIDVKSEEITEIKNQIAKVPFFSPLIVGRAYDILDPDALSPVAENATVVRGHVTRRNGRPVRVNN